MLETLILHVMRSCPSKLKWETSLSIPRVFRMFTAILSARRQIKFLFKLWHNMKDFCQTCKKSTIRHFPNKTVQASRIEVSGVEAQMWNLFYPMVKNARSSNKDLFLFKLWRNMKDFCQTCVKIFQKISGPVPWRPSTRDVYPIENVMHHFCSFNHT